MAEPIKVGVVGLGRIGMSQHKQYYKDHPDQYTVVAACDLIPERCAEYAETFGCKTYDNIADLIADPEVELVDIATRSCDHYKHAKMAMLAGKDALVEKPFCQYAWQAEELVELGNQPGGPHVYVRHNRRFEAGFMKTNEIMDSGILGNVFEIKLTRNNYQRRNDWQTIKEFGGGQLLNWGPHIVDHSLYFCGGKYEKMYSDIRLATAVGDAEDHIKLVFKGVNGRIVDMEISGGAALPTPEYILYGTRGSLIGKGNTLTLKYLDPNVPLANIQANPNTPESGVYGNGETLQWIEETIELPTDEDTTMRVWDYLYKAIREHKPYPITSAQAVEVVRTIEKAKEGTIFA